MKWSAGAKRAREGHPHQFIRTLAQSARTDSRLFSLGDDSKPANILERRDGRIKLADFGISAERLADGGISDPEAARGYVSGTPSFIAPEQALTPNDIDFRADMYALGATLYNAATGFPPFAAATAYDTIRAQLHTDPVPIMQLDPSFDPDLAAAIHRMLRRDRQDRFGSWDAARAALN